MQFRYKRALTRINRQAGNIAKGVFFIGTWPARKLEEALDYIYGYDKDSGSAPRVNTRMLSLFLICLFLTAFVTVLALRHPTFTNEAAWMAGIFTLACLLWMTEALPLFATALLIMGLEVLLLANPGGWQGLGFENRVSPSFTFFLEPLSDPIIVLFLGGFMLARAAVKRGVDAALAAWVLRFFGNTPPRVMMGMMVITAFFSMWMSNTATATMMITLLPPLFAQLPGEERFQKGMLLAIPFAANIGGMGTPIASPPNAVAVSALARAGTPVLFLEWVAVALPFALLMLLVTYQLLYRSYRPVDANRLVVMERKPIDGRGLYVIAIFSITIVLWLTEQWHGLPTAVVALLPIIAFTATGMLNKTDINSLEWNILLLIAGGIALGRGISATGLDLWLVEQLPDQSAYMLTVLVFTTLLLSTFISNTATANLLIPIGISIAVSTDAGNTLYIQEMAMGIALAASLAMALPVSTAPNTIAYAQGALTTPDFVKKGAVIGLLGVGLISIVSYVLRVLFH
ncbi:MAG: SLC13 family permease [Lacibacter sp.]